MVGVSQFAPNHLSFPKVVGWTGNHPMAPTQFLSYDRTQSTNFHNFLREFSFNIFIYMEIDCHCQRLTFQFCFLGQGFQSPLVLGPLKYQLSLKSENYQLAIWCGNVHCQKFRFFSFLTLGINYYKILYGYYSVAGN